MLKVVKIVKSYKLFPTPSAPVIIFFSYLESVCVYGVPAAPRPIAHKNKDADNLQKIKMTEKGII